MNWKSFIAIQVLLCVNCRVVTDAEGRPKRVVNGETLGDPENSGYASPKYYVWIGFARDFFSAYEWKWERQVCGGTLLTPQIVQSACHCFCDWNSPRKSGEEWHYRNSHKFEAVVGCSEWTENSPCKPLSIVKYTIHPLCRKVWAWISHDYALFTLKNPVELGGRIATAPVYYLEEMTTMWSRFISSQTVCMIMGFGRYITQTDNTKSKVLRHGWQSIKSYTECYEEFSFLSTKLEKINLTQYMQFATWTCLKPFGKELGTGNEDLVGKGDSGSPITCDNIYFGLVSQAAATFVADHSNTNDLVFYAYANSAYYRLIMTNDMLDSSKVTCHRDHSVPPEILMHPEAAPRNLYAAIISSGSSGSSGRTQTLQYTNNLYCIFTYFLFTAVYY